MKKTMIIGMTAFCLLFIVSCAPTYQIILKNGKTFEAKTEPVINKESGYVEYLDENNKKVRIKEEEVELIREK